MDSITEFGERATELKNRIAAHKAEFGTHMVSLELKRELVELVDEAKASGMGEDRAARFAGSRAETVKKWREQVARADGQPDCRLLPVRLSDEWPQPTSSTHGSDRLVLVSPGGWRVEGLALPDLLALLQTLP